MQKAAPWILAALAGLVLALAMPGPGLWPLVLLFPALLLEAMDRRGSKWRPWLLGWLAGTLHWVVATHWVTGVMHHYGGLPLLGAVASLVGMGAILGITWAVVVGLTALVPPVWRVWFLPVAWVAVDAVRRFQPFQFPWNDVAVVVAHRPALLGSLPVWGASGLGWALVACGAGLWGLSKSDRRPVSTALLIAAVGCTVTFSAVAPAFYSTGETVRVALLQPGTTLEEKWDPGEWQEIADRVWALTRSAADEGADVVLWPESAVPFRIDTDPDYARIVTELADGFGIEIVLNSIGSVDADRYANSAYLVTADGVSPVRYDKVHLVPFGEYVPPWAELITTDALVREVGRFTPGPAATLLPAMAPLGVSICYEVVFGGHAASQVRGGAEILVTLTNDGWYGFSWAPVQHFAQVRLRAAETRRWFARAALTGISGFVDPYGRVTHRLEIGGQGLLVADIHPATRLTTRVRWGDWWAVLCAVAAVVMTAVGARRRFSENRGSEPADRQAKIE
jgi:apolipoprotein N-acyltransferase